MGGAKTPLGEYLMSQMVPTMQLGQRVLTYVRMYFLCPECAGDLVYASIYIASYIRYTYLCTTFDSLYVRSYIRTYVRIVSPSSFAKSLL